MKILLVGAFEHPMYAPAFESGFISLGHEVVSIKYEDYLYGSGVISQLMTRVQNRFHIGYKLCAYNNDIVKRAESLNADFVFLYRCYRIWPSTVKKLKEKGFFVFTYNNDDPFSGTPNLGFYRNFHRILSLTDVNYVYRKKNIAEYESAGAKNVSVLLPYFIKKSNFKEVCEKDIPLGFLAHFENDGRDKIIKTLVDNNIPITVFNGSDWEKAPLYNDIKGVLKSGKRGAEYNHTINRCQICLVLFSKLNSDTYTRRCFEIPSTETLMLSEYSDDMNNLFPENECAVYFRDESELVEKCRYLFSHPEEIVRIAHNGHNQVRELGGTEVDRCTEIIKMFESKKNQ